MPQSQTQSATIVEEQSSATPTRLSFNGLSGQRPLPTSPFRSSFITQAHSTDQSRPGTLSRVHSHRSTQSTGSRDIDMDMSDEGEVLSDDESVDAETGRPSKKKKGQKFYCTDFPPCNLSFTRSEHLARHIRLDNLRQHAQTVHVNEDIPGDSLAATGTRFQRQIRTDRVRTPTGRSRASTASSQGSHGRGHSRNLSASSVGSTASTISRGDDNRRRPPPLIMSSGDQNARVRPTIDTLGAQTSTPPPHGFSKESSEGLSTPTSTTFSNGASSPGYGSTFDDGPQPAFVPQAAATPAPALTQRLPGIETFDQAPNPSASPARRGGSPMQLDSPNRPPIYPGPLSTSGPNDRRGHASWDMSLHRNLTKLDIASGNSPKDTASWDPQRSNGPQSANGGHPNVQPQYTSFAPQPTSVIVHHDLPNPVPELADAPHATPYRAKRQGWYNGPLAAPQQHVRRRSPEGSSSSESVPTPSLSAAECHPSIVHSDGYIESHQPGQQNNLGAPGQSHTYQYPVDNKTTAAFHQPPSQDNNMTSLEVLVAVATNEDSARYPTTQPSATLRGQDA
ncbi:MAG: hypothetical protein Q9196_006584 [Gyalolechia fulgens]